MSQRIIFLCFVLYMALYVARAEEGYITHPPKGWECISDPQQLPQKIRALYVGKGKTQFTPSINIATEMTDLSIQEYMAQAKTYHEKQSGTRCTALGTQKTHAGEMHILQIDRTSRWGPIRFIQAVVIREGTAYVVTATCLKEEFTALATSILKAIQSLSIPEKILQAN